MGAARLVESTQNNKYAVSSQYLKKELIYEVDVFCMLINMEALQVASIIFDGFGQACLNYPGKFAMSL